MKISISKRNTNTLDISLNSEGKKLVYAQTSQKEPSQNNNNSNIQKQTPEIQINTHPPPPKKENTLPLKVILPKKQKDDKISFQFNKSTPSTPPPSPQSQLNQNEDEKFHYRPNYQDKSNDIINLETNFNNQSQSVKETVNNTNQSNRYETKIQQKEYINMIQNLINSINSNPPEKIGKELSLKIQLLGEMLKTIISFDDSLLNETNILLSYINLFLNDSITKLNGLYFIFFENCQFFIGPKLYYYFDANILPSQIDLIGQFLTKLSSIKTKNKKTILNFYQKVLDSKQITISEQTKTFINQKIEELENEISKSSEKDEFQFNDQFIFNKLNDSELTNEYKSPWTSINSYIKVMFNLSVENFFYPFRINLNELRNNELDPRDLYLYEKVKISSRNDFDEKSEYDFFIECTIRAPNYKEGNNIRPHKLRKIDWEFTDRLSNRSLLFFSLSPLMEEIEAVAISKAKKGEIKDDLIVPISMLQGTLEIDKEYFMFEPVDHWNGPFFKNLLNTNENTLSKSFIKPFIFLDFSENSIDDKDSLFRVSKLFKDESDYSPPKYEIGSTNDDVKYFVNELISKLTSSKKNSLRKTLNDLCSQLNALERQRGTLKRIEPDSEIVKEVTSELQKYYGYLNANSNWPFDSFSPNLFKEKCVVDNEQYKALKYSLNHHLTLVNGAPGTGKTYLACELVKLLINSQYKHPILVVTYKNVSLDGFLDNIAEFLEKNEVSFVRIGGKPRTENKFILENKLERKIPHEIQRIKNQILNLISLQIQIKNSLKTLKLGETNEDLRSVLIEINKSINIKKIMFNQFLFYSKEEEKIITNFYDSIFFIPSADKYFNCWYFGKDYYEEIKKQLKQNLNYVECNLLQKFDEYLNSKNVEKSDEIIDGIVIDFFSGDEKSFSSFLNKKKKKILEKDTTVLSDILNERHQTYFEVDELDRDRESDHLYYYFDKGNSDILPNEVNEYIRTKFVELISIRSVNPNEKMNSLKTFLIEISELLSNYTKILKEQFSIKQSEFENKEVVELGLELSKKKLIAMTATRAAQYKASLDHSSIQFMIIEEAGELTEPMAFSIIPKPVENLVMIGDYRQLRPTVEHKLKFSPYNHDISLFEKEVIHSKSIQSKNLFTLSIQRRMHPQISSLLRRAFYNNNQNKDEQLNDDETTKLLEKPLGFPNHVQFWLHEFEEEGENLRMRSHVNVKEAQICAYLFMLMLCRGYKSNEITIISLYKGQKRQIERELIKLIDFYYNNDDLSVYDAFDFEKDQQQESEENDKIDSKNLNELIEYRKSLVGKYVKCIDDFQGEENEVIIISLTRSEKPGFVKNDNRALVTLSRAKQMEFVIGNKNVFGKENKASNSLWQRISTEAVFVDKNAMNFNGIIANSCPIHNRQQTAIILSRPNHFIDCRFNCCTQKCKLNSFCGHKCVLPCHFHSELLKSKPSLLGLLKRRYFCEERCRKKCKNGHQCEEMCGNCMHFGCPPCSHVCGNHCSLCNRRCELSCSHDGECSCKFSGSCTECHSKINDFHKNLKIWNGNELLCNKCFFRRVESRKYQKGIFKS